MRLFCRQSPQNDLGRGEEAGARSAHAFHPQPTIHIERRALLLVPAHLVPFPEIGTGDERAQERQAYLPAVGVAAEV